MYTMNEREKKRRKVKKFNKRKKKSHSRIKATVMTIDDGRTNETRQGESKKTI